MSIEARIRALHLVLPAPLQLPPHVRLPFSAVRVHGNRAFISGHGPLDASGTLAGPFGKVGAEVSIDQAVIAARLTLLAMLADLQTALGSLDRVRAWLRVFGMVNSAPDFHEMPHVINGASDLILEIFGPVIGAHARSAIGVAGLPWNIPVEIEAEVEFE